MITFTYTKQVNMRVLTQELLSAGFLLVVLSQDEDSWQLKVGLDDSETKDPTAIVQAHVYTPDLQPNLAQAMVNIRDIYQQAHDQIAAANSIATLKVGLATLGDCLKKLGRLVAFIAGTVELDNTEYSSGEINLDK